MFNMKKCIRTNGEEQRNGSFRWRIHLNVWFHIIIFHLALRCQLISISMSRHVFTPKTDSFFIWMFTTIRSLPACGCQHFDNLIIQLVCAGVSVLRMQSVNVTVQQNGYCRHCATLKYYLKKKSNLMDYNFSEHFSFERKIQTKNIRKSCYTLVVCAHVICPDQSRSICILDGIFPLTFFSLIDFFAAIANWMWDWWWAWSVVKCGIFTFVNKTREREYVE